MTSSYLKKAVDEAPPSAIAERLPCRWRKYIQLCLFLGSLSAAELAMLRPRTNLLLSAK